MGDTASRLLGAAMAIVAACHSSPTTAPARAGPSCRDVARRAALVIDRAPPPTVDVATRFFAEVIDLCQEPGLAQRALTCLAQANDLTDARGCPSLPSVADTSPGEVEGVTPPSCRTVVAHAMRVLAREPDAPVSPSDRADEAQLYLRDCADASADGRRCAAVAHTTDAIDECLALRDEDGELELDADADPDGVSPHPD